MDKKQEKSLSNDSKRDRFSELMFGRSTPIRSEQPSNEQSQQIVDAKDQAKEQELDYVQIMTQIDSIMGSINQLKPMIKQLTPFLSFFKKS
jgi:hypothetical protein